MEFTTTLNLHLSMQILKRKLIKIFWSISPQSLMTIITVLTMLYVPAISAVLPQLPPYLINLQLLLLNTCSFIIYSGC